MNSARHAVLGGTRIHSANPVFQAAIVWGAVKRRLVDSECLAGNSVDVECKDFIGKLQTFYILERIGPISGRADGPTGICFGQGVIGAAAGECIA